MISWFGTCGLDSSGSLRTRCKPAARGKVSPQQVREAVSHMLKLLVFDVADCDKIRVDPTRVRQYSPCPEERAARSSRASASRLRCFCRATSVRYSTSCSPCSSSMSRISPTTGWLNRPPGTSRAFPPPAPASLVSSDCAGPRVCREARRRAVQPGVGHHLIEPRLLSVSALQPPYVVEPSRHFSGDGATAPAIRSGTESAGMK